jgi:hypothetical protein
MALKDLIAQKAAMTEDAIESVIKDYIRYDVDEKEVAFLPTAVGLSGKAKILAYLVALQGWPIIAKGEGIATSAKPAHISDRVGIHGGTLRPFLKDLKDRHLIAVKDGAYSVRAVNLAAIKAEMDGSAKAKRPSKAKQKAKAGSGDETPTKGKRRAATGDQLGAMLRGWIGEGFFDQRRTLADIRRRYHQLGQIIPTTSIPKYVLHAVRAKPPLLEREKAEVDGKTVWTYFKKKKN